MTNIMKRSSGNSSMPASSFTGMFDKLFQENLHRFLDDEHWGFSGLSQRVSVPVNVHETNNSYELELVAPGLTKEDLKVSIDRNMLTVSFEHKEESADENKEKGWLRKEYNRRSFSRSFSINETVDTAKISAKYNDGILYLSLPKKEGAQQLSRTIEIG